MALTNSERQRRYRERKKAEEAAQQDLRRETVTKTVTESEPVLDDKPTLPPERNEMPSAPSTQGFDDDVTEKLGRIARWKNISENELLRMLLDAAEEEILLDIWGDKDARCRFLNT